MVAGTTEVGEMAAGTMAVGVTGNSLAAAGPNKAGNPKADHLNLAHLKVDLGTATARQATGSKAAAITTATEATLANRTSTATKIRSHYVGRWVEPCETHQHIQRPSARCQFRSDV